MRWLNAVSVLTLVLSIGTLVITAVGTGSVKPGEASRAASLSSPVVIDADGREVGALRDLAGEGEVGVIIVGGDSIPP